MGTKSISSRWYVEDSILFSRQLLGLKHTFETKSKNQITFFKEALKSQGT